MKEQAERHLPLILARGLTKVYDMGESQVHALRGVDLSVERGEFVAIIGQSGSGKSTLMHILGCLDTPTDGRIFIDGAEVGEYSEAELADVRNSTIGFVFQTYDLLPRFNLSRNTQLPLTYAGLSGRKRRRRSAELLNRVGLGDRIGHRPNQLSGGQCQRAAIARALVTHPEIILADEPTGNLDSASGAIILDMLKELHTEGHTILMVTHEDRIAKAAQRQIRILDGRIVEDTGRRTPVSTETTDMTEEPDLLPPRPQRKRRRRSWLPWLISAAALGAIGAGLNATYFQDREDPFAKLKQPIRVERQAIEERLLETGTVELRTTIEVKSKMSGKVMSLLVEEGDAIREGDVLAIIEPDPNEILRLYQKRAAVDSRWLELQERRRELKRSTELHERGVLPGDQFEKIRDALTASETNYRVATLELQALEREIDPGAVSQAGSNETATLSRLTDIKVLAPRSGIVIERHVEVGELVISGTATTIAGTTIMKLGDLADAIVKASVHEMDIGKIKVGQRVEIALGAYEGETFPAKVHRIAPIGGRQERQTVVSFPVEVRLDELDPRMLPGMTCDLDIVIVRKEQADTLPYSAIFQERDQEEGEGETEQEEAVEDRSRSGLEKRAQEVEYLNYVWVKEGEAWAKQEVVLGLKGVERVEILEGLAAEAEVYPDAERLRWLFKEEEALAKKKGLMKAEPENENKDKAG